MRGGVAIMMNMVDGTTTTEEEEVSLCDQFSNLFSTLADRHDVWDAAVLSYDADALAEEVPEMDCSLIPHTNKTDELANDRSVDRDFFERWMPRTAFLAPTRDAVLFLNFAGADLGVPCQTQRPGADIIVQAGWRERRLTCSATAAMDVHPLASDNAMKDYLLELEAFRGIPVVNSSMRPATVDPFDLDGSGANAGVRAKPLRRRRDHEDEDEDEDGGDGGGISAPAPSAPAPAPAAGGHHDDDDDGDAAAAPSDPRRRGQRRKILRALRV